MLIGFLIWKFAFSIEQQSCASCMMNSMMNIVDIINVCKVGSLSQSLHLYCLFTT